MEQPQREERAALGLAPQPTPAADPLEALLARVAAQEEVALGALYDATVSKVYALARAVLGNDSDAEEAVSDAYTQVWQTAGRFDRSRGTANAWLLTIARSRAVDLLRQRRTFAARHAPAEAAEGQPQSASEDRPADELLALFEEGSAARRALALLGPVPRRLLCLAYFQGLTHQEIAQESGLPLGTVKTHLRRALATLRAELETR